MTVTLQISKKKVKREWNKSFSSFKCFEIKFTFPAQILVNITLKHQNMFDLLKWDHHMTQGMAQAFCMTFKYASSLTN